MTAPDLTPVIGAVVGPTASGKSSLAFALAQRLGAELVSADSMQVYRGMDIGTAKPTRTEQDEVRHHLIDVADPSDDYTLSHYQAAVGDVLAHIEAHNGRALLVGGTGLYLQAVVDGFTIPGRYPDARAEVECEPDSSVLHGRLAALDPVAASRMEPTNRRRVVRALEVTLGSGQPFSSFGPGIATFPRLPFPLLAIQRERPEVDRRINQRLDAQLAGGFLEEVIALAAGPMPLGRTARQALGYKELLDHLDHLDQAMPLDQAVPLDDVIARIRVRTRQFARRQERWFRRDPRVGWLDPATSVGDAEAAMQAVTRAPTS